MLVAANLDCETVWAGGPALAAAVRARLALMATTMRVFAEDGDDLWLPAPVDAARLAGPGPRPRLIADAPDVRSPAPPGPGDARGPRGAGDERAPASTIEAHLRARPGDLRRAWAHDARFVPAEVAAIARTVNDRRFAARLADELGVGLPGARIVRSADELAAHLAAGGAHAGKGAWVAKAIWSAAGRDRVRRAEPTLDGPTRTRVERLLAIHGALAFEPWMPRLLDLGQAGTVAADGTVDLAPPHRGLVDPGGVVRGIVLDDGARLESSEVEQLARVARAAGAALVAAGYTGPFVVDAFLYDLGDNRRAMHPLCELNARLTFGLIARAWAALVGAPLTLGLGGPAPDGAIPLVLDDAGAAAAWIAVG